MTVIQKTLVALLFAFQWIFLPLASAQMTRLNVGYSAASGDQLPAWVAKDSGIFAKNGLDAQVIFFTGGTTAVLALVSGDVPIAQISGPGVVNSVLAGSDAVFVAAGVVSLNYVLMGKPGVKTVEQIERRHHRHQPLRFGHRHALPDSPCAGSASPPARMSPSFKSAADPSASARCSPGRVTAAVINPPSSFQAEKKGLAIFADVAKMGLVFQHTGAVTTKKFIREHPDIVRRYVRSHVEAVARMWNDKEAGDQSPRALHGQQHRPRDLGEDPRRRDA